MAGKGRGMQAAKPADRSHPYVERRPGVCGGEPVIAGTRFPVRSVVTNVYRLGMMPEEMVEAWPYLTLARIHDALSFYHDHRQMIDRAIRENRETVVRRRAADLARGRRARSRLARGRA
jgi:uncharacterized protein (DUF433 family)